MNHGNDRLSKVPNSAGEIFILDLLSKPKTRAFLIMNQVKFPKPKIMLIDCEEQISTKLKEVGYSVCQGTNKGVRSLCLVSCVLEGVRVVVRSIRDRSGEQWTQPMFRFQMDFPV